MSGLCPGYVRSYEDFSFAIAGDAVLLVFTQVPAMFSSGTRLTARAATKLSPGFMVRTVADPICYPDIESAADAIRDGLIAACWPNPEELKK